ncbi:unnamed protein product [Discula destructiva]
MATTSPTIPNPSQTSSHAPLEPIAGTTLLTAALARREALAREGPLASGCAELDAAVLVGGGFERGCVVGVSAEEGDADEVALVLGLQTIARQVLLRLDARAMVVTTMGVGAVVRLLRVVLTGLGLEGGGEREREVLGRVSVARVFDVFGLWEVLGELDDRSAAREEGVGETLSAMGQQQQQQQESWEEAFAEDREVDSDDFRLPRRDSAPAERDNRGDEHKHAPSPTNAPPLGQPDMQPSEPQSSSPLSDPPFSLPDTPPCETNEEPLRKTFETEDTIDMEQPDRTPPGQREMIEDSEQEEGFSSPSVPASDGTQALEEEQSSSLPRPTPPAVGQDQLWISTTDAAKAPELDEREGPALYTSSKDEQGEEKNKPRSGAPCIEASEPQVKAQQSNHPDIILITHMSTLLSSLFHQRDKATAHQTLQLLASHLRYLTRSLEHGSPLIMLLNSTTSSGTSMANKHKDLDRDGPSRPQPPGGSQTPNKPLDPTLRSIFNPPPLPVSGLSYNYDTPHSRRNKPSFGLIFTQMLDMHLLCTKIPKTRADAEVLYETKSAGTGNKVEYVWAIEVLLDEMGLWEGRENILEGKPRRSREQRWGAVEVRKNGQGVRLTDAFQITTSRAPQEIVLAAGFGGRRV